MQPAIQVDQFSELVAPEGFNYSTIEEVEFIIELYGPDGSPISGIPVEIGIPEETGIRNLFKLVTDRNGKARGMMQVPAHIQEFVVSPNYIGIPNDQIVLKRSGTVTFRTDQAGMPEQTLEYRSGQEEFMPLLKAEYLNYAYLSGFNSQGVPSKLEKRETISGQMLSFINNSLPEGKNVPDYHPSYLQNGLNTDVDITEKADVWVTFIHEGAGYRNSLCYYTYSTNDPPSSVQEIDTLYVVFPNASYRNSGGGLYSGDKVKIGRFDPGTSVGFVCISNGWNGSAVGNGSWKLFSQKNLNGLSKADFQQHSILLYDAENKLFYVGFEDIRRDNSSCDNDFNDLVFHVTSNPVKAISTENVPPADDGYDSDNDGVSDVLDEFPNDASLAYRYFYPSESGYGTIAFEDCWPGQGDYDFNDLVVAYQFEQYVNSANQVKSLKCRTSIQAIGANYFHGFGFQMPVAASKVRTVSGSRLFDQSVSLSSNGTESGQSKATIIAFDNDYKLLSRARGQMFNTMPEKNRERTDTIQFEVVFNTPLSQSELGLAPFNPFMFINGERGKEVHLPGFEPTALADSDYFQTYHDNTQTVKGIYYKTRTNLPFALHVADVFEYPLESRQVHKAHLKFVTWAQSGGVSYTDWFTNKSGYRETNLIYRK